MSYYLLFTSRLNVILFLAAIAAVSADSVPSYQGPAPSYNAPRPSYNAPAPVGPAQYNFNYAVKDDYTGNDFGHEEGRNGYDTQGSYYVQLPDSRLQKVDYVVKGDSGYLAQVSYQGEAQYPQYQPSQGYQPAPKVIVLLAVMAVASADSVPSYRAPAPSYHAPAPTGPAQYNFNYAVKDDYSGNDFGHEEGRNGYDTQGSYYVQLPDGRLQKVDYVVKGDSGYLAQVNYQGEAQYPRYQPSQGYQPAPKVGYA
ncbi:cuticle protein 21-like [Macrobrachium rosenbergii]|uniref:cuticle protein 21-like n=1 Tax=Macrobrachium rosenbergii TaxID=79674 RepID=UPI0034D5D5AE